MNRAVFVLLAAATTVASLQGQDPAPPPAPAQQPAPPAGRGGGPQVVSPEIRADRAITFRFHAPTAKTVTVSGELDGQSHPMTRGADGLWTVTVGPLRPDILTREDTDPGTSSTTLLRAELR
jgi:hypothetical protein